MGKKVGFGVVGIGNMGNSHVISSPPPAENISTP